MTTDNTHLIWGFGYNEHDKRIRRKCCFLVLPLEEVIRCYQLGGGWSGGMDSEHDDYNYFLNSSLHSIQGSSADIILTFGDAT
jgi:hypothetical protein